MRKLRLSRAAAAHRRAATRLEGARGHAPTSNGERDPGSRRSAGRVDRADGRPRRTPRAASKLPFREYRTAEFLNRQPVVADRFDVMTVVQRLQVAGELAAAVAVDLDQSMPVTIELQQPGGLAAYEARAAAARIDPHAALVQQVTDSGYARQVADGMHAEISEAAPLISAPIPTKPSRPVDPTRTSSSQPSRKLEQERHRSDRQARRHRAPDHRRSQREPCGG
jgi:hypothetical protein